MADIMQALRDAQAAELRAEGAYRAARNIARRYPGPAGRTQVERALCELEAARATVAFVWAEVDRSHANAIPVTLIAA